MILKAIPQKQKDEFDLINDIRIIKGSSTDNGKDFINYEFPKLPAKFNKIYYYKGEKINLYNYSCTCRQFEENSKLYPGRDIRRACKHIYFKASVDWLKKYIGGIAILLLQKAVYHGIQYLYKTNIFGKDFYFIINPDSAWINVITLKDETMAFEYTYHTIQKRWGYSNTPDESVYIVDQIQKIIKFQLPVDHPYKKFIELEKF